MNRNKRWAAFQQIQSLTPWYMLSQKTESDRKAKLFAEAHKAVTSSTTKVEVLSDTPVIPVS